MPIDEESLKNTKALIEEARSLQKAFVYIAEPMSRYAFVLNFLNEVPLFNSLLKRLNNSRLAISGLAHKSNALPMVPLDSFKASPFIGIATSIIDFIQIPMIYTAALILGEKPPISLSNNAKWLFATTTLALSLLAFLIPVTAPITAITIGSLELLATINTLGFLYYRYYEDKKNLKLVMENILSGPSGQLDQCIIDLNLACQNPNTTTQIINDLTNKIIRLKSECEQDIVEIKKQYKEASQLEEKLKIELKVMDASVRMVTFSLVVAGTVTSLFFPPIGLSILLAAALGGALYIFGRLVTPYVPTFHSSLKEPTHIPTLYPYQDVKGSTSSLLNSLGKVTSPKSSQREQAPACNLRDIQSRTEPRMAVGENKTQSKNPASNRVSSCIAKPQRSERKNSRANTHGTESSDEKIVPNQRR